MMKCDSATAMAKYGHARGFPLLPTVRNFGRNLFLALRVLHVAGYMHCDVKPENLLLSADGQSIKKPISCSAPRYVDYLFTWVQNLFDDERIFPTEIGRPFPPDFLDVIRNIFKRLRPAPVAQVVAPLT